MIDFKSQLHIVTLEKENASLKSRLAVLQALVETQDSRIRVLVAKVERLLQELTHAQKDSSH